MPINPLSQEQNSGYQEKLAHKIIYGDYTVAFVHLVDKHGHAHTWQHGDPFHVVGALETAALGIKQSLLGQMPLFLSSNPEPDEDGPG